MSRKEGVFYLIQALRDNFLQMKPMFTNDERTLNIARQFCAKDGSIKIGKEVIEFKETSVSSACMRLSCFDHSSVVATQGG